ncbi:MAG: hypothetical protein M3131_05925 [Actinomycetota bacterium]|nr:hypothetical protein [Actinomycetota bacterium]
MTESKEERAPEVGEHDEEDSRGGGGGGGLSGAAPGVEEEPTPEGESSPNEAKDAKP